MNRKIVQPEIFYEESVEGISHGLPFMKMTNNDTVPKVLFIGACKDTDEVVEGSELGETITEIVMQSYYNSDAIKEVLPHETYTQLKKDLGLIKN